MQDGQGQDDRAQEGLVLARRFAAARESKGRAPEVPEAEGGEG